MKVAIFGKKFSSDVLPFILQLYVELDNLNIEHITHHKFANFIKNIAPKDFEIPTYNYDNTSNSSDIQVDFLLCIGGDGTILDTVTSMAGSTIPIVGINTGRLGFLANNSREDIKLVLDNLIAKNFSLEERGLLCLTTENNLFGKFNFALNEITVHKKDSASMITLHTYIDDVYLNSYWSDGLIIATPTGSTAYSLSCGGPILDPRSKSFVINPIAPHSLTARPIIIPDDVTIKIVVEGRDHSLLTTLDSRSKTISSKTELFIRKSDYTINLVKFEGQNFFKTIRAKLLWGLDNRNEEV
jgi:NAD+ kinase